MKEDFHYYCVFVLANLAGYPKKDAKTIAYCSQYVDNSTDHDEIEIGDYTFDTVCTAYNKISPKDSVLKAVVGEDLSNLITIDPHEIDLYFSLEKVLQKVLSNVPITLKNFPEGTVPQFSPDSISVNVRGPESILSSLQSEDVSVSILYEKFLEIGAEGNYTIKPEISIPDGITVVRLTPAVVRFSRNSVKD